MAVTASKLRANVYRLLDAVLDTGVPVEIVRRRRTLKIIPGDTPKRDKLAALKRRPKVLVGDPEELLHRDWSREWKP